MKKITTMILALVATMTAAAQNLTVSGTLKGLADGTPLELRILSHDCRTDSSRSRPPSANPSSSASVPTATTPVCG